MQLDNEIWKDIPGYEGLYQASNLGRIKSLPKVWYTSSKRRNYHNGKILRPGPSNRGHLKCVLYKDGGKRSEQVHRLVALAFMPPSDPSLIINHKDLNPANNHIDNLEWCTYAENTQHAERHGRMYKAMQGRFNEDHPNSKPIIQMDRNGHFINEFPSLKEIKRQKGWDITSISKCALGQRKTAYDCIWKYKEAS